MGMNDYRSILQNFKSSKRLGQNFLINKNVAKAEARFASGRNAIELGAGAGILTEELCKEAKSVIAVEKDKNLYEYLNSSLKHKNLELINDDFFDVPAGKFKDSDIMVSNIPYNLSSKVLMWLGNMNIPAVLCVQKEFADHMTAKPGQKSYSKLSVFSSLQFTVTYIMKVPANDFFPMPRVESSLVYLKPKKMRLSKDVLLVVSLIMEHKKKKIRNAIIDSASALKISKEKSHSIIIGMPHYDRRAFQIEPEMIVESAEYIVKKLKEK